jgi:SAM-dependent methyltransferase
MSPHHHQHDAGFDWEAMADALEADGALLRPLVDAVVADIVTVGVDPARVTHVVDAGCGPGVIACALARHLPEVTVTGLDSSGPLLERFRGRATAGGLGERVVAVEADLEGDLPALAPADLVWVSMVAHHLSDPVGVLRRIGDVLRPGGTLVLVEFAGSPRVLPDDDSLVAGGAWRRLQEAATSSLLSRLGFDAIGHDWPADLARGGLVQVTDRVVAFRHDAPLDEPVRRWLVRHVRGGLGLAGEALTSADTATLQAFAAAVEDGTRIDPFVEAERRVLTAQARK